MEADSGYMKVKAEKYIKAAFATLLVVYISYLSYLTFLDHVYGRDFVHRNISVVPFKAIIAFVRYGSMKMIVVNILGNMAAFVPMGFLLPGVFRKLDGFKKVLLGVSAASLLIETLQFVTGTGISDIDDIILNVIGGVLGYLIYKAFYKLSVWIKTSR